MAGIIRRRAPGVAKEALEALGAAQQLWGAPTVHVMQAGWNAGVADVAINPYGAMQAERHAQLERARELADRAARGAAPVDVQAIRRAAERRALMASLMADEGRAGAEVELEADDFGELEWDVDLDAREELARPAFDPAQDRAAERTRYEASKGSSKGRRRFTAMAEEAESARTQEASIREQLGLRAPVAPLAAAAAMLGGEGIVATATRNTALVPAPPEPGGGGRTGGDSGSGKKGEQNRRGSFAMFGAVMLTLALGHQLLREKSREEEQEESVMPLREDLAHHHVPEERKIRDRVNAAIARELTGREPTKEPTGATCTRPEPGSVQEKHTTVLITGASGVLGKAATASLLKRGFRVIATTSRDPSKMPKTEGITWVRARFGEDGPETADFWESIYKEHNVGAVINAAGAAVPPPGKTDEDLLVKPLRAMVDAASTVKDVNIVNIGSIAGLQPGMTESYAVARIEASRTATEYARSRGVNGISLEPDLVFNGIQAGKDGKFIVDMKHKFSPDQIVALQTASPVPLPIPLVGGGEQRHQPVYLRDLMKAAVNPCINRKLMDEHAGEIVPAVGPQVFSMKEMFGFFAALGGQKKMVTISVPGKFLQKLAHIQDMGRLAPYAMNMYDALDVTAVASGYPPDKFKELALAHFTKDMTPDQRETFLERAETTSLADAYWVLKNTRLERAPVLDYAGKLLRKMGTVEGVVAMTTALIEHGPELARVPFSVQTLTIGDSSKATEQGRPGARPDIDLATALEAKSVGHLRLEDHPHVGTMSADDAQAELDRARQDAVERAAKKAVEGCDCAKLRAAEVECHECRDEAREAMRSAKSVAPSAEMADAVAEQAHRSKGKPVAPGRGGGSR